MLVLFTKECAFAALQIK